jgi:hypothetical protein
MSPKLRDATEVPSSGRGAGLYINEAGLWPLCQDEDTCPYYRSADEMVNVHFS